MVRLTFRGIHPAARKDNTRRKPLMSLERAPKQVFLSLEMSPDAIAVPLVKLGEQVLVGQTVARPDGEEGAAIHASVSGRVAAIRSHPHPWGGAGLAIVLENDGKNTPVSDLPKPIDPAHLIPQELLERVRQAGVVGMGGGAWPTHKKLAAAMGHVDTLIINAAECEPYVTADQRLLTDWGDQILQGAFVLCRALRAKRAVLAAEGDQLGAVERLERLLRKKKSSVELVTLRTRYPLGAEKQLVQAVTGREVPPGGTALDVKCAVFNVATVFAVSQALFSGTPLTHRVVTVAGGAVARPRNLWVPIGTPLRCLLETAGGLREEAPLILTGGPMMGVAQSNLEAPVLKDTNALLCLSKRERYTPTPETVCIRCGHCIAACPMRLAPAFVCRAVRLGELHRLDALHVEDCLECGCCTYSCPSQIPLLDLMRQAKALTAAKGGGDL